MRTRRRMGAVDSELRGRLIEAAAQIIEQEGSAAVTAGHLAAKVGLQRHIVHYYFGTIEDLLVAVLRRDSEHSREWLARALQSDDPLRFIWELGSRAAAITLEFSVLATRHDALRKEFKQYSEEFRRSLTLALEQHFRLQGITTRLPPVAITIALQSIAFTLTVEGLLDIREGHDAMRSCLASYTDALVGGGRVAVSGAPSAANADVKPSVGVARNRSSRGSRKVPSRLEVLE